MLKEYPTTDIPSSRPNHEQAIHVRLMRRDEIPRARLASKMQQISGWIRDWRLACRCSDTLYSTRQLA